MKTAIHGAGLGLRRALLDPLKAYELETGERNIDFLELVPENWIGLGGRYRSRLSWYTERYPCVAHGLSLSIGSPSPLDLGLVRDIKAFLAEHGVLKYTEHLSYCSDHGHLYDLMPIPFTEEAVHYVADRIRIVQDVLEQKIGMEHVSYYAAPQQEMTELEFFNAVVDEAGCEILLDVNNIYVNSVNHNYDPVEFLQGMPGEKACYVHIAGHFDEAEDLKVDTHGSPVIDPVWGLLEKAYELYGPLPTLLERDFNIPAVPVLMKEIDRIRSYQLDWRNANPGKKALEN